MPELSQRAKQQQSKLYWTSHLLLSLLFHFFLPYLWVSCHSFKYDCLFTPLHPYCVWFVHFNAYPVSLDLNICKSEMKQFILEQLARFLSQLLTGKEHIWACFGPKCPFAQRDLEGHIWSQLLSIGLTGLPHTGPPGAPKGTISALNVPYWPGGPALGPGRDCVSSQQIIM